MHLVHIFIRHTHTHRDLTLSSVRHAKKASVLKIFITIAEVRVQQQITLPVNGKSTAAASQN